MAAFATDTIVGMDVGLNDENDARQLVAVFRVVDDIDRLREALFIGDPDALFRTNSRLGELMIGVTDPAVDPRLTFKSSLLSTCGPLEQITRFIREQIPTTPVVLSSLLRSALLGAARVVYVLDAEDEEQRRAHLNAVMRQENHSLKLLYDQAKNFEQLRGLVPPEEILEKQRARFAAAGGDRPPGEATMLRRMAVVVATKLASLGFGDTQAQLVEHVSWVFNIHSGVAHGFGWPKLVPGTDALPGRFIADLTLVTSMGQLAFNAAWDWTRPLSDY